VAASHRGGRSESAMSAFRTVERTAGYEVCRSSSAGREPTMRLRVDRGSRCSRRRGAMVQLRKVVEIADEAWRR
jgi:hypothetical protein